MSGRDLSRKKKRLVEVSFGPLTENRMRDMIACLARGLTPKEVAQVMNCSHQAVKNYMQRLRVFFGAGTTLEAVLLARKEWNLKI